jgi:hypothetical protein
MPSGKVWFVTGDFVAMYPNIPIENGIQQIASMLNVPPMYFESLEATNLSVSCERSELEGPDKQIQIVAAQMLSVNLCMPYILAISQLFLTKL